MGSRWVQTRQPVEHSAGLPLGKGAGAGIDGGGGWRGQKLARWAPMRTPSWGRRDLRPARCRCIDPRRRSSPAGRGCRRRSGRGSLRRWGARNKRPGTGPAGRGFASGLPGVRGVGRSRLSSVRRLATSWRSVALKVSSQQAVILASSALSLPSRTLIVSSVPATRAVRA